MTESLGPQKPLQAPALVNVRKLEEVLNSRVDQIADLLLLLTYGEMIELTDEVWKAQPEETQITQANLPALLHRWATDRQRRQAV
jgi:hypothetical protein